MDAPAVDAPVAALLDRLTALVRDARAMPMSASCIVNRDEVLGLLDDVRRQLPEAIGRASTVLEDRERVVAEGRAEAERLVAEAKEERSRLVAQAEVVRAAKAEAKRVLDEAEQAAEETRREVEDYVDSKLANFEVVLGKTLDAVHRGRARLHGVNELDALGEGADAPLP